MESTETLNRVPICGQFHSSSAKLLYYDCEEFRANFNRKPFRVRHTLVNHPLLSLSSLVELSRRLPVENVKYNLGNLAITQDFDAVPNNGLTVEETIESIEECRSWMVLKYAESDAKYRQLLNQCLNELKKDSETLAPGMCDAHCFIFITSPHSITPCHIDPEINFLLQIRGSKIMSIFDPMDREIISEKQLEEFFTAEHFAAVTYQDEFQSRAFQAALTPGVGVHCPVTAPHWIKNGPEVSISFSVTFRTPATYRRAIIYQMNSRLRRAGLNPAPQGSSLLTDAAKYQLYRGARFCKRAISAAIAS